MRSSEFRSVSIKWVKAVVNNLLACVQIGCLCTRKIILPGRVYKTSSLSVACPAVLPYFSHSKIRAFLYL